MKHLILKTRISFLATRFSHVLRPRVLLRQSVKLVTVLDYKTPTARLQSNLCIIVIYALSLRFQKGQSVMVDCKDGSRFNAVMSCVEASMVSGGGVVVCRGQHGEWWMLSCCVWCTVVCYVKNGEIVCCGHYRTRFDQTYDIMCTNTISNCS